MLSAAQLQQFEDNGFLVVEDVLDQQQILDPVRQEYLDLLLPLYVRWQQQGRVPALAPDDFDGMLQESYRAGCDWFQPLDISLPGDRISEQTPMHFGPAIFDMLTAPRLLDLVESLIGPEITSNPIQHVRIKPPARDLWDGEVRAHITQTDWHQDRAVALAEADQTNMVTIWCAVSDATVENGCLKVVPGAHRKGMLPHCPKRQTCIADGFIDEGDAVPLPVKSGGVVIFHPLVPHASMINQSETCRWSFDLRYNKTGEPTGRSHFPDFVARSAANPASELRDWQHWLHLWQNARKELAAQPHIDIHRWTSDAPFCA